MIAAIDTYVSLVYTICRAHNGGPCPSSPFKELMNNGYIGDEIVSCPSVDRKPTERIGLHSARLCSRGFQVRIQTELHATRNAQASLIDTRGCKLLHAECPSYKLRLPWQQCSNRKWNFICCTDKCRDRACLLATMACVPDVLMLLPEAAAPSACLPRCRHDTDLLTALKEPQGAAIGLLLFDRPE